MKNCLIKIGHIINSSFLFFTKALASWTKNNGYEMVFKRWFYTFLVKQNMENLKKKLFEKY